MASVLIIDDDKHIRHLIKAVLEPMGHQIVEAANGKDALQTIQSNTPSLVIVDIFMPEIDGIEIIKNLRNTQSDIKIIAISGRGALDNVDVLEVAQRLGATHTLPKPFEIRELFNIVQDMFPPDSAISQSA